MYGHSRWKNTRHGQNRTSSFIACTGIHSSCSCLVPFIWSFTGTGLPQLRMSRQDRLDVYTTNLGLFLTASVLSLLMGIKAYLLIQVPIIMIAHFLGIWLFYVQHQYDEVSWERGQQWDYKTAALSGSSFLKLPAVCNGLREISDFIMSTT